MMSVQLVLATLMRLDHSLVAYIALARWVSVMSMSFVVPVIMRGVTYFWWESWKKLLACFSRVPFKYAEINLYGTATGF